MLAVADNRLIGFLEKCHQRLMDWDEFYQVHLMALALKPTETWLWRSLTGWRGEMQQRLRWWGSWENYELCPPPSVLFSSQPAYVVVVPSCCSQVRAWLRCSDICDVNAGRGRTGRCEWPRAGLSNQFSPTVCPPKDVLGLQRVLRFYETREYYISELHCTVQ